MEMFRTIISWTLHLIQKKSKQKGHMKIKMYFINIVVKALLVELLCLIIIDANGMSLYFSGWDDYYRYHFFSSV